MEGGRSTGSWERERNKKRADGAVIRRREGEAEVLLLSIAT